MLPIYVLCNHLWVWFLSRLSPADAMMPIGYQLVLKVKDPVSTPTV